MAKNNIFTDRQLENYGRAIVWGLTTMRGSEFEPNDAIMIKGGVESIPLLEVLHRMILEAGLQPIVRILGTDTMDLNYYNIANDSQLDYLHPWWKEECSYVRGNIYIDAPTSLTHLKDVPPEKQQRSARAVKPWREFLSKQEQQGLFAWTVAMWPTQCRADKAGLTLKEYTNQVIKACYLNSKNIEAAWEKTQDEIERIKDELNKITLNVKHFHMESARVDLKITPGESRQWMGGRGANIPSFEIFTSPDWRGTSGVFFADQPSYRSGHLIKDARLEFKQGNVIRATAKKGQKYLRTTLETDEDAKRTGEFSLTDKRHSKIDKFMADTLFDENFGGEHGNSHIAVGSAYLECYSGDQEELTDDKKKELGFTESVVHWDLINTEDKTVTAVMKDRSRLVIYENGMFTV